MDYKKILEGVVDIINTAEKSDIGFANICTYIGEKCPELAESEDEKIRKELIDIVAKSPITFAFEDKKKVLAWLEKQGEPEDKGEISDGYHTFNELYYYRLLYNAAFFNLLPKEWVHKSKKHHDGEECFGGGWFIVMANLPTGQISNHYELKDWDLFQIPEKEVADEWDGHTPQEAADRLHKYLLEKQGEQKPAGWNEEDEKMCQETIDWFEKKCFPYALENDNPARESIKWLKSLKNKVQPQNTWKPSDEQMEALFVLLPTVCNSNPAFSLYNDLKKLKGE